MSEPKFKIDEKDIKILKLIYVYGESGKNLTNLIATQMQLTGSLIDRRLRILISYGLLRVTGWVSSNDSKPYRKISLTKVGKITYDYFKDRVSS